MAIGSDVILGKTAKAGTDDLDNGIREYVRAQNGLEIDQKTARQIREADSLVSSPDDREVRVSGRDVASGQPKETSLSPGEVREALRAAYAPVPDLIVQVLEDTPPELAGDILTSGLTLSGQHPRDAERYLSDMLQLPVRHA